jgi:hypothetical protein
LNITATKEIIYAQFVIRLSKQLPICDNIGDIIVLLKLLRLLANSTIRIKDLNQELFVIFNLLNEKKIKTIENKENL